MRAISDHVRQEMTHSETLILHYIYDKWEGLHVLKARSPFCCVLYKIYFQIFV